MMTPFKELAPKWKLSLMARFNLTPEQACGILGNLGYESVGFTKLQEIAPTVAGSRGGYGVAQWTGSRRLAFEAWCRKRGLPVFSDDANYGYLCVELAGPYARVIAALRKETDLGRCVFVFGRLFEAPSGTTETHLPGFDGRLNYANQALVPGKLPPIVIGEKSTAHVIPADVVAAVMALQTALAALGLYTGAIDGQIGPATSAAAMRAYQMAKS